MSGPPSDEPDRALIHTLTESLIDLNIVVDDRRREAEAAQHQLEAAVRELNAVADRLARCLRQFNREPDADV